jgi:hypothetical protein
MAKADGLDHIDFVRVLSLVGQSALGGRGISGMTADSQLARIFREDGNHRKRELIRLLLDAANEDKIET